MTVGEMPRVVKTKRHGYVVVPDSCSKCRANLFEIDEYKYGVDVVCVMCGLVQNKPVDKLPLLQRKNQYVGDGPP